MISNDEIKKSVKEKYAEIAKQPTYSTCCGTTSSCCTPKDTTYTVFQENYTKLKGYVADADLGLGCGLPTEFAGINEGDTVVDLGSGAGNDVFIARQLAGETGKVVGLDMTEEMIDAANKNNNKLGYKNVSFVLGDIEKMPIEDNFADVVVSNCVLNLVPDKQKAFREMYRILKKGAHFCVSDIVILGELPEELKKSAVMYAGCVSGALQHDEYLNVIKENGFTDIEIKKTKRINLPDELLSKYLTSEGMLEYKNNFQGLFSITVVGYKK